MHSSTCFPCLSGSVVLCLPYIFLAGQTAGDDEGQWPASPAVLAREDAPLLAAREQKGWSN